MLDRLGNDVDFTELFMEETLSSKDKKELPDSMYGLVYTDEKGNKVRKFPLNDESHVRQAAIFFDRAKGLSNDQKRELARNIVRRAKELDMDYSGWESLKPYLDKSVKESYDPDPDSTTGTSNFDDSHDDPDDCFCESFEEMFGPVIQEAFDAVTGEEIPINHAYTMEEMAKRTFSESELQHIKHNDDMSHVDTVFFSECYFTSPKDYGKSITLDGPLFVTPYKSIASIFCGRDKVKESIPKIGSYNLGYKEWTDVKVLGANNKPLNKPLKEVHVYVEGYPFLESKTIEAEGFIHCINAKTYSENFYKYPWMAKDDREYLIANTDDGKVKFTRTIKCKVRYIIEGKPARPGQDDLGPRPNGLTHWIHEIANKIHAKYKADQKEPTGNQNCLLCSWCAEAQMRGQDYLPRPIYSPRDPALEIVPGDIIGGVTKKNPGNFYDMLEHLRGDSIKQPFARWYCHVKWGHSNGGHEFLIVKVDEDSFVIMDAQQGTVKPLNADDSYMKNVDWEGTYICRIDDKPFKYMKLDKINDPKKTLPWDPKKDIPYMVKHGLCTKEEAEKELKKTETNLFTSELKNALGQTPIQESVDSLALFKQLPKDLQEYLKKGDFSDIDEEYGIDGYGVEIENISSPEYLDIAGHTYDLKEDDKFYNSIDFATDGGGNDFVYNPADGFYYSLDHEMWDEYDHIHGDKLSSRKWSELIDPNHNSKPDDYEFKTERDTKFRNICEDPTYAKLCNLTLTENVSNLLCSSISQDFKHPYFENKVWAFANQYDYESIENAMTDLHLFIKNDFQPKLFIRNKYDIDGLKSRSVKFIESMLDEAKRSHINTALCNYQTTSLHKRFVEKYGLKSIQEGAWNDIRNGVNPWSKKRVFHITQQGHLDGQIFNPRVPEYLDKYDPSKDKFEDVDNPRVCFSPSIEGALNAIMVTIGRWKTADKLRDWYVYIPEKPIDQYKHKTTKELVKEKKVYDANVTNEVWIEEPVRLKQYGIIRVDQVSDKHIKKTVPTTTGFQGHRYRYDFKYHWVVKPKVIADVPYDYTPIGVCKDMVDEGYNFKYGLGANGSVQKASPEEYDKNYRLESPEEFEKNGGGICFDFVEWQAGYLEAYGYTCRKFFISTETDDNMTHTFILVDGGNGELIYPEISFELLQGVHEVKSPEEAIRMIIEKMIEYHKTESIKYYVWEYSGHPPYGSNIETCTKYFSKGEPFHEGTLNKPKKIK